MAIGKSGSGARAPTKLGVNARMRPAGLGSEEHRPPGNGQLQVGRYQQDPDQRPARLQLNLEMARGKLLGAYLVASGCNPEHD